MGTVTHLPVVGREITAADYAANHDIDLDAGDITDALGYTPADASTTATDAELAAALTNYYTETQVDQLLALINPDPSPVPNGLVSGGDVIWVSALQFRVTAATYFINGTLYSSAEQAVTLSAADGSNPRIDVLVLDTAGTFAAIAGTPAVNPSEPDIDPSTQLKLTFVLVQAGATAPTGVTVTNIYLENTEWTSSTSGSGWNAASTNNPKSGTKCIEGTNVANNAYVLLDKGAVDLDINGQRILRMYIRSKASWASGRILRAQWFANGVAKGSPVTIATGYWGFDSSQTSGYQLVAIPIAQFVVPAGTLIDQLRITDVGGTLGLYIDEISLESYSEDISSQARFATVAELRAGLAAKAIDPATLFAAAAEQTLTDQATVTWNMNLGFNAKVTLGGNRTIATPTNPKVGITYILQVIQDGTGTRVPVLPASSVFDFGSAGAPTFSTAAGKRDFLVLYCYDATTPAFRVSFNKAS